MYMTIFGQSKTPTAQVTNKIICASMPFPKIYPFFSAVNMRLYFSFSIPQHTLGQLKRLADFEISKSDFWTIVAALNIALYLSWVTTLPNLTLP